MYATIVPQFIRLKNKSEEICVSELNYDGLVGVFIVSISELFPPHIQKLTTEIDLEMYLCTNMYIMYV